MNMKTAWFPNLIVVAVCADAMAQMASGGQKSPVRNVFTCATVSLIRPERGVAYRGLFANDDYRFSVTIPNGLTGWEGSDPNAPFHGFALFLDKVKDLERSSCIVLRVELASRSILPDEPSHEPDPMARSVKVGNRTGFQTKKVGPVRGVPIENVTIFLELPRDGYANSFSVTLVTPESERFRTEKIFHSFVSSLKFW